MVSEVGSIILGAAQRHGVNPNALSTIAHLESRGNPMAKNPRSSAGGLFQFIDSTANAYGLQDRFDPVQASEAAARLTKDNAGVLQRALGRDPSIGELYLAHQQGAGGATKLLSNPNARAVDVVGADAVRLNGGRADMTAQEFANLWINKANRVAGGRQVAGDTMKALGKDTLLGSEGNDNMAEQPQGLLGGTKLGEFLTPDRRDHLIAALEGMTLNPNQALIQAAGGRIQQRQQDRAQAQQANRTAEFLRQRGRDDLAAAVASGSVDPRAAVQAALTPATDDRTALIKNFEFARQSGFEGSFEDYLKLTKTGTTVNVGEGQPRVGTIPQGFQLIDDGQGGFRMAPIPGGPADTSEVEKKAKTQKGVQRSIVDDQIDTAFSIMEKKGPLDLPEAGIIGSALGSLGINQEAVDLKNTLASIQGSVAFDTLQKMREASKTGGALGAVSERELDLLISTMGALQQDTSPDLLKRNLNTIRRIMGKITNDPVASRFLNGSPSDGITTTTLPPADDGGFVIKRSF